MLNTYLYKGQFLEAFKYSQENTSIRGLSDPHDLAFNHLLFNHFHYDSMVKLRSFASSSKAQIDIINFYYCLVVTLYRNEYNFLKTKDFKKFMKFTNNEYNKLLDIVSKFIENPKKNNLKGIEGLSLEKDLLDFVKCLCFKFTTLPYEDCLSLFPELEKIDNLVSKKSPITDHDFNKAINDNLFNLQIYLTKFIEKITINNQLFLCNKLLKKGCLNSYLLSRFLELSFNSNNINGAINDLFVYYPYLDRNTQIAFNHHLIISLHLTNNFHELANTFHKLMGDDTSKVDSNGFYDWDLDDNYNWDKDNNIYLPTFNFTVHQNARLYLNTIFLMNLYRFNNKENYLDIKGKDNISVIGGSHTLSWTNLSDIDFSLDVYFKYSNFYNNSANTSLLDINLKEINKLNENSKIVIFEYYDFINYLSNEETFSENTIEKISLELNNFFKSNDFKNDDNVFIISIPLLNDFYKNKFQIHNANANIREINSIISNTSESCGLNYIDINQYLKINDNNPDQENFINNYFVNPDIIINIINEEILN